MKKFVQRNLIILAGGVVYLLSVFGAYAVNYHQCQKPLKSPRVMVIVPTDKSNPFWNNVLELMKQASVELGIKLNVQYLNSDENIGQHNYVQALERVLSEKNEIDYLISIFWIGIEKHVVEATIKNNIRLFSIFSPINNKTTNKAGLPEENYQNWIGHMTPDDYQVGYDLADFLIKKSRLTNNNHLRMVAINGKQDSDVSIQREKGLLDRVALENDVELLQIVNSNWSSESGEYLMENLLNRFKNIDIIWSASDNMTIGIVNALKKRKSNFLKNTVIGSIDWSKQIVPFIKSKDVDVSYGGHVFYGAYILSLIYDHYNNYDFNAELGPVINTRLQAITAVNIDRISSNNFSKINFKALSKCSSGYEQNKSYKFSPLDMLQNIIH